MTVRPSQQGPDFADLIAQALTQLGALLRRELDLMRAETTQALHSMMAGLVCIGIGILTGLVTLITLAETLRLVLATLMSPVAAAATVCAGFAVLTLVFLLIGRARLRPGRLTPRRTLDNIRKDRDAVKEVL